MGDVSWKRFVKVIALHQSAAAQPPRDRVLAADEIRTLWHGLDRVYLLYALLEAVFFAAGIVRDDFFVVFSAVCFAVFLAAFLPTDFDGLSRDFFRAGRTINCGVTGEPKIPRSVMDIMTTSSPAFKGSASIVCFATLDTLLAISFTVCIVPSPIYRRPWRSPRVG
jgi:hypothetical protein